MDYPIDWNALIKALAPQRGDKKEIGRMMQAAGVVLGLSAVRRWGGSGPNGRMRGPAGDAAVWLALEANRLGIKIPVRETAGKG